MSVEIISVLQVIREYVPEALAEAGASVETDDHFMASMFVAYYKKRIDARDHEMIQACLAMANDPRLYQNESAKEAMETTVFISIHVEGSAYSDPFVSALTGQARRCYDLTIERWTSQF